MALAQIADFGKFQARILSDPEWYLRECLGLKPWSKEIEMIESVRDFGKTLVAGCVGSGKTHATAGLVFWWLLAFAPSARVFALAPTERQLKINLWGEIPRIHANSRIPLGGNMMPLSLQYRISEDWFAMGFSPQDKMGVFGIHGPHDLLIIDDAQGLKQEIWGALENAMAGGTTKLLASCNPVVTSGEIFDALTSKRGKYNVLTIPAEITPNVMAGHVVIPGMITKETVDKWVAEFGEDSDFVRTKVRAKLPKQEPDTLIPLDWIEAAMTREVVVAKEDACVLGVDVARFGNDRSVNFRIKGRQAYQPQVFNGNDTMQVSGHVKLEMETFSIQTAFIDVIGIGSGVVDRLLEQGMAIHPVNVGSKSNNEKKFVNLRAEVWWGAREALNPTNPSAIALPNNPELMAELAAPKFSVDSSGRIKVESKEEMKKRLGRSPDLADGLCLAIYGRNLMLAATAMSAVTAPPTEDNFLDALDMAIGDF